VNNLPAKLLIESPRGAYCFLPADLKPGLADWTIHDQQRSVRLRSWVLALQMSADKLKLMKGESTAFHVFIKSVETIPQEAWVATLSISSSPHCRRAGPEARCPFIFLIRASTRRTQRPASSPAQRQW